jgi:hypothetical protein
MTRVQGWWQGVIHNKKTAVGLPARVLHSSPHLALLCSPAAQQSTPMLRPQAMQQAHSRSQPGEHGQVQMLYRSNSRTNQALHLRQLHRLL